MKSSGVEPYTLSVSLTPGEEWIECGCKAGANKALCKHLKALLSGDVKLLGDPSQEDAFIKTHNEIPPEWSEMLAKLLTLEGDVEAYRKKLAAHKKMMIRILN